MIVALLSFTLYRFLETQLRAIHVSQEMIEGQESMEAVVAFLRDRLGEMTPKTDNQLLGAANQFHGQRSDEITWLSHAGQGVLTSAAPGQYRVTMAIQPVTETSRELELGLRRERLDKDAQSDVDFFARGTAGQKYNWLSLIRPMAGLEIRYFDKRLNLWVNRWSDPKSLPALVRVKLWKEPGDTPWEAVLPVPASRLQR